MKVKHQLLNSSKLTKLIDIKQYLFISVLYSVYHIVLFFLSKSVHIQDHQMLLLPIYSYSTLLYLTGLHVSSFMLQIFVYSVRIFITKISRHSRLSYNDRNHINVIQKLIQLTKESDFMLATFFLQLTSCRYIISLASSLSCVI